LHPERLGGLGLGQVLEEPEYDDSALPSGQPLQRRPNGIAVLDNRDEV
jgi:hypothetical protein